MIIKTIIFILALCLTLSWIFGAIIWYTNRLKLFYKIFKEKHSVLYYNIIIYISVLLWGILYYLSNK